jgi:glycerol-3-phosphate dehydrogenase subunit C
MSDSDAPNSRGGPLDASGDWVDLRSGSDDCYACSTCDTNCPVAAVEDSFPGPKFQGPEQWRLSKPDATIDPSIAECSNCMRCDTACPSDVPLSEMHNEARAEYVRSDLSKLSRTYWRNRLLANYRTSARLASKLPRLANAVMRFGPVRWLMERTMGITAEREFPAFATETFREWWADRGGRETSRARAREGRERLGLAPDADRKVAYFHGCYANYNTPEVARATVRVFEHFGYEVVVPEQRCSGTPMFANGMLADARRHAEVNLDSLGEAVEAGYSVITSCTSCSMALRKEYPELFDLADVDTVAEHTWEALEFLRTKTDVAEELAESEVEEAEFGDLAYHAPCHARNQGLDGQPVELFADLSGASPADVGDSCSGISGTYGWKDEHYETSMAIGADMFEHMEQVPGETGLTECPTCASQMAHGTDYEVRHPLEIVQAALCE